MSNKPKIIVIWGPTASGKSDLAVQIAKKYNGEIISADSRQVYKKLDIGTGKIIEKEMGYRFKRFMDRCFNFSRFPGKRQYIGKNCQKIRENML